MFREVHDRHMDSLIHLDSPPVNYAMDATDQAMFDDSPLTEFVFHERNCNRLPEAYHPHFWIVKLNSMNVVKIC